MTNTSHMRRNATMAGIGTIVLLLAGCASTPPAPTASIEAAKVAISTADKAEASQFASAELTEAREKLALADGAVTAKDMVGAERFANESRVEAELATAKTGAAKAGAVNEEMNQSTVVLTEEMQRAGDKR